MATWKLTGKYPWPNGFVLQKLRPQWEWAITCGAPSLMYRKLSKTFRWQRFPLRLLPFLHCSPPLLLLAPCATALIASGTPHMNPLPREAVAMAMVCVQSYRTYIPRYFPIAIAYWLVPAHLSPTGEEADHPYSLATVSFFAPSSSSSSSSPLYLSLDSSILCVSLLLHLLHLSSIKFHLVVVLCPINIILYI